VEAVAVVSVNLKTRLDNPILSRERLVPAMRLPLANQPHRHSEVLLQHRGGLDKHNQQVPLEERRLPLVEVARREVLDNRPILLVERPPLAVLHLHHQEDSLVPHRLVPTPLEHLPRNPLVRPVVLVLPLHRVVDSSAAVQPTPRLPLVVEPLLIRLLLEVPRPIPLVGEVEPLDPQLPEDRVPLVLQLRRVEDFLDLPRRRRLLAVLPRHLPVDSLERRLQHQRVEVCLELRSQSHLSKEELGRGREWHRINPPIRKMEQPRLF